MPHSLLDLSILGEHTQRATDPHMIPPLRRAQASDKCLDCQSGATSRPPRRENRACGGSDSSSNVFVVTRNRVERARRAKPKSKWNSDGKETPFRGHGAPAVRATVALPAITTRRRDICVYRAALTLVRGCVRARPGRRRQTRARPKSWRWRGQSRYTGKGGAAACVEQGASPRGF